MSLRIGIITLSASYNCGSMLQSYALKEVLKQYGDVEIINFSSKASHKKYDIVPKTILKKIKMRLKRDGLIEELEKETSDYKSFQREYLKIVGKEYFAHELCNIANKYDVVVAGSDQVWNVCMEDFDGAFFCNWTKKKKVAYAPSLGGYDIRESDKSDKYISALKTFEYISVREEAGQRCLQDILKKDIVKVLDPTLILGDDKWIELASQPQIEGEYIFYYSWAYGDEELKNIVKSRSEETGLPVYVIDAHKWRKHSYDNYGFKLYEEAGPKAFLSLMANAKECFVESFHGMIFAYLFQRNFWLLDSHPSINGLDSRLSELVKLIGAEGRIVTPSNKENINFEQSFYYEKNECLKNMKEVSIRFLEEAFQ